MILRTHISLGQIRALAFRTLKATNSILNSRRLFWPAYDRARREGKSPNALLDPNSPDYIAKCMLEEGHGFVRPMNVWAADVITDQPPKPGSFDIKTVKTLPDLVAAYRAGNVTKPQAEEMAVQNGWAVRKPKPAAAPISQ